jgi:hypothetical protein
MMRIGVGARVIGMVVAGLIWASVPGWTQVQLGNQWAFNAGGSISAGYSGSFTNEGPSSHGVLFGGSGDISGSYHSPQFISFDVSPFYNQSRDDSTFQSISDSSGVTANTTIFGGSKYPGYVNYSRVYNSEGNYFVPGIANYRTNGDSQSIGVGWSFNPTSALSLRTGFQEGDNNFSLYGLNGENFSNYHTFFASANYNLAGFRFGGGVTNTDSNNSLPQELAGQPNQLSKADSTTYYFNLSRVLALSGNTWMNLSRNTTGYNVLGTNDTQTTDVVTAGVALKPTRKLSTNFNADYDDNLAGSIYQAETSVGILAPLVLPEEKSHSWGVNGEAQYTIADQFYVSGNISHRQQVFLGTAFDATAYSGDIDYGHDLWGGRFTAGTIVTDSTLGNGGGSMLGVLSNAIYIRKVGQWSLSGSGGYSRNAETILIAYTTSGYNYSVSATRRLGKLNWNGAAGGSKNVLAQVNGANSLTQNYSTGLSSRRLGASAGYAKSSGMGLYTAQGITSLPTGLPPTLLPTTVLYGGTSYSAGVGGMPIRGLTFSGTFVKSKSNTENSSVVSNNDTEEAYVYLQYKVRKIFFTAGYSRLVQGFSASATAPAMVSTYYFGISRWFNFF